MTSRVSAFAPATVANLGPGFDVLGAALDGPGDTVTAWRAKKPGVRLVEVKGDRGRLPLDAERNTASVAAAFEKALAGVWKAQRFSWWMTTMLHTFPESLAYDQKLQDTDLAYLFSSEKALGSLAENYVGLPF